MKLYHELGAYGGRGREDDIRSHGMSVADAISHRWADIDNVVPNRPRGIFFWGEDLAHPGWDLVVDTDGLDTTLLFGFPAEYAEIANEVASIGPHILRPGALEVLASAQPIAFADWDGVLPVEWIYTGDIPPLLSKS